MKSPNDLIEKLTGMILELLKHTETGMRKLLLKKRSHIPSNKCCPLISCAALRLTLEKALPSNKALLISSVPQNTVHIRARLSPQTVTILKCKWSKNRNFEKININ